MESITKLLQEKKQDKNAVDDIRQCYHLQTLINSCSNTMCLLYQLVWRQGLNCLGRPFFLTLDSIASAEPTSGQRKFQATSNSPLQYGSVRASTPAVNLHPPALWVPESRTVPRLSKLTVQYHVTIFHKGEWSSHGANTHSWTVEMRFPDWKKRLGLRTQWPVVSRQGANCHNNALPHPVDPTLSLNFTCHPCSWFAQLIHARLWSVYVEEYLSDIRRQIRLVE
jgi:hypothetical protein